MSCCYGAIAVLVVLVIVLALCLALVVAREKSSAVRLTVDHWKKTLTSSLSAAAARVRGAERRRSSGGARVPSLGQAEGTAPPLDNEYYAMPAEGQGGTARVRFNRSEGRVERDYPHRNALSLVPSNACRPAEDDSVYALAGARANSTASRPGSEGSYAVPADSILHCSTEAPTYDRPVSRADILKTSYDALNFHPQNVPEDELEAIYSRPFEPPADTVADVYAQLQDRTYCHLARRNVQLRRKLGAGTFGIVREGKLSLNDGSVMLVAVKSLHDDAQQTQQLALLQEAAIMSQFQHKNVVRLFGVVTDNEGILLVMEKMKTSLKAALEVMENGPDVEGMLLRMSRDIASGMAYLAGRAFVHRDLAARNVLINDSHTCKIGDFGMSRYLKDDDYYTSSGGVIPIRWCSPEVIHHRRYSTASDVWSYGIVLYEIFSFGMRPYGIWLNQRIITEVDRGWRLKCPRSCPKEVYELMGQCWEADERRRPLFHDIERKLYKMMASKNTSRMPANANQKETAR